MLYTYMREAGEIMAVGCVKWTYSFGRTEVMAVVKGEDGEEGGEGEDRMYVDLSEEDRYE